MRHSLPIAPQFYVTAPQSCPYLDEQIERKLFTALQGDNAQALNDSLSKQGFDAHKMSFTARLVPIVRPVFRHVSTFRNSSSPNRNGAAKNAIRD